MSELIGPHGGKLCDLYVDANRRKEINEASRDWPSWTLTERQLCDLELLANGAFSPLTGFVKQADYESICAKMRLADGTLWPMPIPLDVTQDVADTLSAGSMLALRDMEGLLLAVLHVEELYTPDRHAEAEAVFGTKNTEHPGVDYLFNKTNPVYLGGRIEAVNPPAHHDYRSLRSTPKKLRAEFAERGWTKVVAFQTRNPMHRAHFELTYRAAEEQQAKLLVHPVVGQTKPGDIGHYVRVRCYRKIMGHYPEGTAQLSLLPLAMRLGGPREALWHAIIRKNFGCTHLIVGRDHAGPGSDSSGKPFYDPYGAQQLLREHEKELGVSMVPFQLMVYLEKKACYMPIDEVPEGEKTLQISGTELRRRLNTGEAIPDWFTFPDVAEELQIAYPPLHKRGLVLFFTGLSGSGKSTVANVVVSRLQEYGGRSVMLLDGDVVRTNLSSELGFSKEHRDINIRRIGYVASEVGRAGGIAVCAPIAPYDATRKHGRILAGQAGASFVLVHVATSLEECERRDRKGLYAKARAGIIKEFTGISDPYEAPTDAEVTITTEGETPEESADKVMAYLREVGILPR